MDATLDQPHETTQHEGRKTPSQQQQQQQQQQQKAQKEDTQLDEDKIKSGTKEQPQEAQHKQDTQQHDSLPLKSQVEAALRQDRGSGARLVSWAAEGFTAHGDNYLSVVRRLRVTYDIEGVDGHTSYVAKVKPSLTSLKDLIDLAYEKECFVYDALVTLLNDELQGIGHEALRLPRCFFCSTESGREVVILEDLGRKGFKMADRRQGLDAQQAELVVREVARLHAASNLLQAACPAVTSGDKYAILMKDWHNYSPEAEDKLGPLLRSDLRWLAAVVEAAGGYDEAVAWLRQAAPRATEMFREQVNTIAAPFKVLCHGDCWVNNFLFRYDAEGRPTEVALLDLQMCRWGSLALDLNTFAYTSINPETRRVALPKLLSTYWHTFSGVMEARRHSPPFTQDQLQQEYRDKSLFGLLMGADYLPTVLVEAGDTIDYELLQTGEEEWEKHRGQQLHDILSRNPILKITLCSLIDELSQFGVVGGPLPGC